MFDDPYRWLTNATEATLRAIAEESRGNLSEDNQSHCDMAQGALRLWSKATGADVQEDDRAALEAIIAAMPRWGQD